MEGRVRTCKPKIAIPMLIVDVHCFPFLFLSICVFYVLLLLFFLSQLVLVLFLLMFPRLFLAHGLKKIAARKSALDQDKDKS